MVELRARASEPNQTQPDYISKFHLHITFHQQLGDDDTNEGCVKLSAACGLYHYNREVSNDLNKMSIYQTDKRGNMTRKSRITMKKLRSMLHDLAIRFEVINGGVAIKDFCSGLRFRTGGLFLVKVVDLNGTRGHSVVLDLFRRVILDPAEKHEVDLNKHNLLKCAGPMSLCLEFQHVIEIRTIRGDSVHSLNVDSRKRRKEEAVALANLTPQKGGEKRKEGERRHRKNGNGRKRLMNGRKSIK